MDNADTLITTAQLAEIAGVTSAAVSNWRRRQKTFPAPAEFGPGGRALFSLTEARAWLEETGRADKAPKKEEDVLSLLLAVEAAIGGITGGAQAEQILCALITLRFVTPKPRNLSADSAGLRAALAAAATKPEFDDLFTPLVGKSQLESVFTLLGELDKRSLPGLFDLVIGRIDRFSGNLTNESLNSFLVWLVLSFHRDRHGDETTIYDPACGYGELLWDCAVQIANFPTPGARRRLAAANIVGQDIDCNVARAVRQNLVLHGVNGTIKCGDSLLDPVLPSLKADVVVCHPPYGLRLPALKETAGDRRWLLNLPGGATADFAWLQHCLYHLGESGRAYVTLPISSFSRGGRDADVRRQLIRAGAVETVIALPGSFGESSSAPVAVWILRPPGAAGEASSVLLIDFCTRLFTTEPEAIMDEYMWAIEVHRADPRGATDELLAVSAEMPGEQLLNHGSSLDPRERVAEWKAGEAARNSARHREEVKRDEEQISLLAKGLADQVKLLDVASTYLAKAERSQPEWLTVAELTKLGRIEILDGIEPDPRPRRRGGAAGSSVPKWTPEAVVARAGSPKKHFPRKNDPISDAEATRPGDLVVAVGTKPHAVSSRYSSAWNAVIVDEVGGAAVESPAIGLRIVGDWISTSLAAAILESAINLTAQDGDPARAILEMQLPVIDSADLPKLEIWAEQTRRIAQSGAELQRMGDLAGNLLFELIRRPGRPGWKGNK